MNEWTAPMEIGSVHQDLKTRVGMFFDQLGPELNVMTGVHKMVMSQLERPLLETVYNKMGRNAVHTARVLGLNRNTLNKRLRHYGIK